MATRKINRYFFTIGNGFHDIRIPKIEAPSKAEAFRIAKNYRGVPTDKITLDYVKPFMELKRVNGKMQWMEVA